MSGSHPKHQPPALLSKLPIFYGWIVVAVAFITMGIGVNSRSAFSLLFPPILEEFGWERGMTAAAFSIGFIVTILYTPLLGAMMTHWGPRVLIPLSAILVSAGLFLVTFISEPWQLYLTLGVLVVGGSLSMSYVGHGMFIPNWFVKNRGLAVGIAFSGVGVGSVLLFPWIQSLIDSIGWREACWSLALLLLVVLVPLNFLLQRYRPEDMGLSPDGESGKVEAPAEGNSVGELPSVQPPDNVVDQKWASTEWTLSLAMKTSRFWWLSAGLFSILFAWYGLQIHQTKYLIDIGIPSNQAAFVLGLVPSFGIVGQIALGYLSDRIGREWGWTFGSLGFALGFVLLLLIHENPDPILIYLMAAAQGLLGYGIAPIYAAIPAELFKSKHYGIIFGTFTVSGNIGAGTGPWVTGVIYDYTGSYFIAFYLSIGLSLFSILCIWMSAPRKVRVVAGQVARLQAAHQS